jgi:hypothetical protein
LSGREPANRGPDTVEFLHYGWTAGAVNRAVHSAAARQGRVRRVGDGVHGKTRDVALDESETATVRQHMLALHRSALIIIREIAQCTPEPEGGGHSETSCDFQPVFPHTARAGENAGPAR